MRRGAPRSGWDIAGTAAGLPPACRAPGPGDEADHRPWCAVRRRRRAFDSHSTARNSLMTSLALMRSAWQRRSRSLAGGRTVRRRSHWPGSALTRMTRIMIAGPARRQRSDPSRPPARRSAARCAIGRARRRRRRVRGARGPRTGGVGRSGLGRGRARGVTDRELGTFPQEWGTVSEETHNVSEFNCKVELKCEASPDCCLSSGL